MQLTLFRILYQITQQHCLPREAYFCKTAGTNTTQIKGEGATQLTCHNPDGQFKDPRILEAPLTALRIAPSTLGLAQKSPQTTSLVLLSQIHLSSPPIEIDGKAPPLQFYILTTNQEDYLFKYSQR